MTDQHLPLEFWVGTECTVNRVHERWRDQSVANGFDARLDDIDRFAALGAKRLRFPLIWERTSPEPGVYHWDWADSRIARAREAGLPLIAGLLHHGSGPAHTSLLDPEFPEKLASYARAVAERYPHIDAYTPVNEPLTTARFSALYGVWYPHARDDESFIRALLNQVRGTVLAMRAIREVNPAAQLVQTDDLGHTEGARPLRYQSEFENHRRWLGFDLLCGKVDAQHPLRYYLRNYGVSEQELQALVDAPCLPGVIGINYYVTSERFLDDRIDHYPEPMRGGNGRDRYVDVELARVVGRHIGGFAARLREASQRYGLPLAITEAHLGCTREEQMRWLWQAWQAAQQVRSEGHDVRAVTAWAALGTYDWDSLLTVERGNYEPGLFDVTSGTPRPTALAGLARELANGVQPTNPVLEGPGWWQRELRLEYPCHGELQAVPVNGREVLITGATGTLGRAVARFCELRGLPYRLLSRRDMDIADPASVHAALEHYRPWAVINTAGFVRVDEAENDRRQWRENVEGPQVLATACAASGIRFVTFSSDLVFDGAKSHPYVESDALAPLNAYGRAKAEAERRVLESDPRALVVRTAAFFGPWDPYNFATLALETLRRGERFRAADDQCISPTYVPDLVQATLDLLVDGEAGVWHLANRGAVSWAQFARQVAQAASLDPALVQAVRSRDSGCTAARPPYSALGSERGVLMPTLQDAITRYLTDCTAKAGNWPIRAGNDDQIRAA
ncbi:MAG TPA: family 1 glycosylhydrolase, partial [Ramlibacter sp.]|nr:family 1 glycosylhydrolase [Ramlibacter sp.]